MLRNSYALKFFIIIELVLGLDFLYPSLMSNNLKNAMTGFMILPLWAGFFIIFSILGYFAPKLRYYIIFVSIPLMIFAATAIESIVTNGFMGLTGITTYSIIAIGSIIIAAKVYRNDDDRNV